jgi:hypothetical protein
MSREGRKRWGLNQRFLIGAPGNPMMMRWRLLQTPLFGVYVHFIYREDLDPAAHDHPWSFWSLVLRGAYVEHIREDSRETEFSDVYRTHDAGTLHHFPLHSAHRIIDVEPGTTTLVFVGRKKRTWGFYEDDGRWTDYRDAMGLRPIEGAAGTGKRPW